MTQLTEWDRANDGGRSGMTLNKVREEVYFTHDRTFFALDLKTLATRALMEVPSGYDGSLADATADGRYVLAGFRQDLSDRFEIDLGNGYIGFNEIWAAPPALHDL